MLIDALQTGSNVQSTIFTELWTWQCGRSGVDDVELATGKEEGKDWHSHSRPPTLLSSPSARTHCHSTIYFYRSFTPSLQTGYLTRWNGSTYQTRNVLGSH